MKTIALPLLDQVRVAAPCPVPWDSMQGDDTTRYCSQCSLNVHNLSAMTRDEAEGFLQKAAAALAKPDGRVCVNFYRRQDGTILTQDCPVGLALLTRRARLGAARAVAAVGALCASVAAFGSPNWMRGDGPRVRHLQPFRTVSAWLAPKSAPPPVAAMQLGGSICAPSMPAPAPALAAPQSPTPAPAQN